MPGLSGHVAAVLNSREMVINVGEEAGVRTGMVFRVLDQKMPIKDPRTGDVLGEVTREKIRVKVVELQRRLSIARTFETYQVNVGGTGINAPLSGLFGAPRWETRVRTLRTEESGTDYPWPDEASGFVQVGDPVELVEEPAQRPTGASVPAGV